MAASQSQHRCVFVGNIPYDASEEQLIQICEEVGPVVNFRLVVDRETGKPKGYGFCEYKDEETALSARRNLQGYEINGRQLRVDFAENDKKLDRNLDVGRGGSASASSVDPVRQSAVPAGSVRQSVDQPVGYSVAMAAATVIEGALGSAQITSTRNKAGLQGQASMGTDSLTQHLALMSKSQLTEVVSEFKALAKQNKEQAQQLLLAMPNFARALFQVEIMLGLVSSQLLMMPNSSQAAPQLSAQSIQTLTGLPPLPQNRMQGQESRISTALQYAVVKQSETPFVLNAVFRPGVSANPPHLGFPSLPTSSFSQVHDPSVLMLSQISSGIIQPTSTSLTPGNTDVARYNLVTGGTTRMLSSSTTQLGRTEKLMKLNDRRATPSPPTHAPLLTPTLPQNVDGVLLQQVLSLTAEQLSSLPPDERQEVIKLQQALRRVR